MNSDFISGQVVPVNSFIIVIFYLIGIVFLGTGFLRMKRLNEGGAQQYTMLNPVMRMLSGVSLLTMGGIYSLLINTVSDKALVQDRSLLAISQSDYLSDAQIYTTTWLGSVMPHDTLNILVGFVWLYGLVSFGKGLMIMTEAGEIQQQGQQHGLVKRIIVHLVAGLIAMNIFDFACVIGNTFGIDGLCT